MVTITIAVCSKPRPTLVPCPLLYSLVPRPLPDFISHSIVLDQVTPGVPILKPDVDGTNSHNPPPPPQTGYGYLDPSILDTISHTRGPA